MAPKTPSSCVLRKLGFSSCTLIPRDLLADDPATTQARGGSVQSTSILTHPITLGIIIFFAACLFVGVCKFIYDNCNCCGGSCRRLFRKKKAQNHTDIEMQPTATAPRPEQPVERQFPAQVPQPPVSPQLTHITGKGKARAVENDGFDVVPVTGGASSSRPFSTAPPPYQFDDASVVVPEKALPLSPNTLAKPFIDRATDAYSRAMWASGRPSLQEERRGSVEKRRGSAFE